MALLVFTMGPVASGKTAEMIIKATQLQNIKGYDKIKIFKPSIDTRFSPRVVKSDTGLQTKITDTISPIDDLLQIDYTDIKYIFIDEIQFFTVKQIEQLREISLRYNIEIMCYGLLKDFKLNVFESSKRLLELCDDFRQISSYCTYCNGEDVKLKNASMSMKIQHIGDSFKPVIEGESICIGGIETYVPVCYECFHKKTGYP